VSRSLDKCQSANLEQGDMTLSVHIFAKGFKHTKKTYNFC
jgi:hypothetical protein